MSTISVTADTSSSDACAEVAVASAEAVYAKGPKGDPGPGFTEITLTAGSALGGHRAVIADGSSQAQYADHSIPEHLGRVVGITTGAAVMGADVAVTTSGEVIEPSWDWTAGKIFLGINGLLTQLAPTTGFIQVIGVALSPTKMLVDLQTPVLIGD